MFDTFNGPIMAIGMKLWGGEKLTDQEHKTLGEWVAEKIAGYLKMFNDKKAEVLAVDKRLRALEKQATAVEEKLKKLVK